MGARPPFVTSARRSPANDPLPTTVQCTTNHARLYQDVTTYPFGNERLHKGQDSSRLHKRQNAVGTLRAAKAAQSAVTEIDAGRLRANVDFARGGYDVAVANYRRVVLTAMQEAEDGITGLAALESAAAQAQVAIASARHVLDLATSRYEGGVTTYLDVITGHSRC